MSSKATSRRSARQRAVPPRVPGKVFVLDGKLSRLWRGQLTKILRQESGSIVSKVSPRVTHLVLDASRNKAGRSIPEKAAARLNAAGAGIAILDVDELFDLLLPSVEEAVALLDSGPAGWERFSNLQPLIGMQRNLSLRGADLRGRDLRKVNMLKVDLEGADLRGADLRGTWVYQHLKDVRLEGARAEELHLDGATSCSFDGLDMRKAWSWHSTFTDCSFRGTDLTKACFEDLALERCCLDGARARGMDLEDTRATGLRAREADFSAAVLRGASWPGADLTGAVLEEAHLMHADLTGATLAKASLHRASLLRVNLAGADLRGTDLRRACLAEADLGGARIRGANFEGANLRGCNLTGLDLKQARGLAEAARRAAPAGPHLKKLDALARKATALEMRVLLKGEAFGQAEVSIDSHRKMSSVCLGECSARLDSEILGYTIPNLRLSAVLGDTAGRWGDGSLSLDSLEVKLRGGGMTEGELRRLVVAAWSEAVGQPVPTEAEARREKKSDRQSHEEAARALIAQLRSDKQGVAMWNALPQVERKSLGAFKGADLSGARLDGIHLESMKITEASFAGASLKGARLSFASFIRASFEGASLEEARGYRVGFIGANFRNASLENASLRGSSFQRSCLAGASLRDADLSYSNLRGADLSGADLAGLVLEAATFDSKTTFPKGFRGTRQMKWVGEGPRPEVKAARASVPGKPEDITFETFLDRLPRLCDPGRIANALTMLKAERFQLFSQVEPGHVVGVVRSQSTRDRVYSCRLDGKGDYACCTQNLNICGGLRGAPCKHLLVLLIGLAKAGELEPGTASHWLSLARGKRPELNRDTMSETFLRYKGAEAGEVDWRPTETIPEDFYAL